MSTRTLESWSYRIGINLGGKWGQWREDLPGGEGLPPTKVLVAAWQRVQGRRGRQAAVPLNTTSSHTPIRAS